MRELSIKIKIADREYPMTVLPEDEERIRTAARMVNEQLKKYREQFNIDDKQDLLAFVAFDAIIERLGNQAQLADVDKSVIQKVNSLNQMIENALK